MLKYLLGLGLLLAISACGDADKGLPPADDPNPFEGARVGTDSTLEVMTWNLENFAKAGNVTIENVADIISALEVDVVALQEIKYFSSFDKLRNALPGYQGVHSTNNSYINLAYLYRTDGGFEPETFTDILSEYSYEFKRLPFLMRGKFNGEPFVVINNHLKCCGDGVLDESRYNDEEKLRKISCEQLEAFVEENLPGERVFIVGDLNDILTDAAPNNVFQNFLDRPERFRFADMDIAQNSELGVSYPNYRSHIDHIIISSELFDAFDSSGVLVAVVPLSTYFRYGWSEYEEKVSDHLPVVLKMKF